jgi:hypothetical protein
MNTKFTKEQLAVWIAGLKEFAKQDVEKPVFWFVPTMSKPFSIIAGWQKMFTTGDFADLFCCSKSRPGYVMCLKIVETTELVSLDFDNFIIPFDKNHEVDDLCIPLELDDSPEAAAEFFLSEWERIMEEHGKEI